MSLADPSWGNADALVTIVWFGDLQCPFTGRGAVTIADLQARYRPDQLRVVWKNLPLPFHKEAAPAADTAMAVYAVGGNAPFWKFIKSVLTQASAMGPTSYDAWVQDAGLPLEPVRRQLATGAPAAKVDADAKLAKEIGINGTPHFFLNGVAISGAQPTAKFDEVMDAELKRAEKALAAGGSRNGLYARLTTEAFEKPAPPPPPLPEEDDKATFRVPIGTSPVRGKPTALVTIVEFSDFQCPFCKRVQTTIDEVEEEIWRRCALRVQAQSIAVPSPRRAGRRGGPRSSRGKRRRGILSRTRCSLRGAKLEDDDLESIARSAHLDVSKVKKAIASKKYAATIAEDADLSDEVKASGTPHFFINGRRLVGAQPIEKFTALIDEELTKAKTVVARGVRKQSVYDELQKSALEAEPPEMKTIPAATADQPFLGSRDAKIVIVEFADFQCPFCSRVEATMQELSRATPGSSRSYGVIDHSRFTPTPIWPRKPRSKRFGKKGTTRSGLIERCSTRTSRLRAGSRRRRSSNTLTNSGSTLLGLPPLSKITATRRWSTPTRRWPMRRASTGRHRS